MVSEQRAKFRLGIIQIIAAFTMTDAHQCHLVHVIDGFYIPLVCLFFLSPVSKTMAADDAITCAFGDRIICPEN